MAESAAARPTAVVTGALRGIGRECALALAKSGFNVLLNDLPVPDAELVSQKLVAEIETTGAKSAFLLPTLPIWTSTRP
jgi:NAD(P)-dependent dehydrogenase (short-subunit alcohol dehydrogenase family)